MGWIENAHGEILLVRQTAGRKHWALPGGKINVDETLVAGLHREIAEETGLTVAFESQVALFDRPAKQNLTFVFRVTVEPGEPTIPRPHEISAFQYTRKLPGNATPALRHFWKLFRGK